MTATVIRFPGAVSLDPDRPDRHGISHAGVLATIVGEMPEDMAPELVVLLAISRCTTEVRGRTVTIRWPDHPRHVLRVPLSLIRRNSRRVAS